MARSGEDKMSGLQKSAILLIALGPEKSANLFKHLKEEEIEELTLEIANTRSITPQIKEGIIEEFYQLCLAQQYIAEGGIGYAKELLEKALGQEKAQGDGGRAEDLCPRPDGREREGHGARLRAQRRTGEGGQRDL